MGRRPVVGPCTMAVDSRLLASLAPCMLAQSNWGWNMVSWLIELVSYWWADELDDWACAYCWKRACSTKEHTIWPSGSGKWDAHKFHSAQALTIKGQVSWRCHECTICLFFIADSQDVCGSLKALTALGKTWRTQCRLALWKLSQLSGKLGGRRAD